MHCSGKTARPPHRLHPADGSPRDRDHVAPDGQVPTSRRPMEPSMWPATAAQHGGRCQLGGAWSTITVSSTASMPYTTNTFWVLNPDGTYVLVTCTGFVLPNSLTGCNVDGAVQANAAITSGALSNASTGADRRLHQDRAAGRHQGLARRDDGDPELRDHGAEPGQAASAIRRRTPSSVCSVCATTPRPAPERAAIVGTVVSSDFVPNALFDTREALYRDVRSPTTTRCSAA